MVSVLVSECLADEIITIITLLYIFTIQSVFWTK